MTKHYFSIASLTCLLFSLNATSQRISSKVLPEVEISTADAPKSGGGGNQCAPTVGTKTSIVSATSSALFWKAIPGASGYEVEVENALGNIIPYAVDTAVTDTACIITGLRLGASYKFKVRTLCGNDHSGWSSYFFFTQFGKGYPACSSTVPSGLKVLDITKSSVNLSWASAGAAAYAVEVEGGKIEAETETERRGPAVIVLDTIVRDTACFVNGLSEGTPYKFKVRSICYDDTSHWSVAFNYMTAGTTGPVIFHTRKAAKAINTENVEVALYPNPAHDAITISGGSKLGKNSVFTIYDVAGNAVLVKQLNNNLYSQIPLSHLTSGLYYAVITSDRGRLSKKLNIVR